MNSAAANTSLFDAVDCGVLLCGLENIDTINIDTKNVDVVYIPSPRQTWDPTSVPAFPFTKSYDEAIDEPILVRSSHNQLGVLLSNSWLPGGPKV